MNTTTGSALLLDAEALYGELLRGVRALLQPDTRLAGITSGGAWLVERLQRDLGLAGKPGVLSSALHRDDFAQRGMAASAQTQLDFDVNGADILVLDDVLYTGRTVRAVLNELFDYGRPASIRLAGEFHTLLAAMTGNEILARYVNEVVSRGSLVLAIYGRPHSSDCAVAEHRELITALVAGATERAIALMDEHLASVASRALLENRPARELDLADLLMPYAQPAAEPATDTKVIPMKAERGRGRR